LLLDNYSTCPTVAQGICAAAGRETTLSPLLTRGDRASGFSAHAPTPKHEFAKACSVVCAAQWNVVLAPADIYVKLPLHSRNQIICEFPSENCCRSNWKMLDFDRADRYS
jgi:hypothetical protein